MFLRWKQKWSPNPSQSELQETLGTDNKSRARRTKRCHCKFWYLLNFTTASVVSVPQHGFLIQAYISDRSNAEITKSCDFLLVRYSNLCPILHHFRDTGNRYSRFFVLLTLILGVFPLDQIAHVARSAIPQRHGRTDGLLWHNRALRSIAR